MPRQRRIVIAQTALVAVLVIAIYLWLLRPEDSGDVHGIHAPGGNAPSQIHAGGIRPGGHHGAHGSRLGSGRNAAGPRRGGAALGGGGTAGPGVASSSVPAATLNPPGDQYRDEISALKRQLGLGGSSAP